MGVWGYGIYDNDTALDVKDEFEEKLQDGQPIIEIAKDLIREYKDLFYDTGEAPPFWYALADILWKHGEQDEELMGRVLPLALVWMKSETTMSELQSKEEYDDSKRKQVLHDLKTQLLQPPPDPAKPRKSRGYVCPWKYGDVFAYKLESDLAKERGLFGRYFLIQKVDVALYNSKHVIPIVYVKLTEDENLPRTLAEFDRLPYVQRAQTMPRASFMLFDLSRIKEGVVIDKRIHKEWKLDEHGYLPEFRTKILMNTRTRIPDKVFFVGNFAGAAPPPIEYINVDISVFSINWVAFAGTPDERTFESVMLDSYCKFNLGETETYREDFRLPFDPPT